MVYIEPAKGQFNHFILGGVNLTQYLHCVRVYYSVCKSYVTAQVVILDNNNVVENLGVVAGMSGAISFSSPPNQQFSCTENNLSVLKMKGEQVEGTLKYQKYIIDFIGPTYFKDRANTVRESFKNTTGTGAISKIWNDYIGTDALKILNPALGFIGTPDAPFTVNSLKPLTAIADIMKNMVGQKKSGSWMIYRDRDAVNVAQLESMMDSIKGGGREGQQEYFIQKETWGANFNDRDIYHAIIVAQMEAGRGDGGRGSGAEIAATAAQTLATYDTATGLISGLGINPKAGSFGGVLQSVASALGVNLAKFGGGGMPNIQMFNSVRSGEATAPPSKTVDENSYSAEIRNGPQLTLKVPLQTGLNVTVGKGIWVDLMPPTGDFAGNIREYLLSGPWLVADAVHELYSDEREVQGSSSFQCVKGAL